VNKTILLPTPDSRRVFLACLLSFAILMTPMAALAGRRGTGAESQESAKQQTTTSQSTKATANGTFVDPAPAMPAASPVITASMTDSLENDDADNKIDPTNGNPATTERIVYSTTISNQAGALDATGVTFTDVIDTHTTLVANSVDVSPLAGDDSYDTIGNTLLEVGPVGSPSAQPKVTVGTGGSPKSVFDNDTEFLGDTFTLSKLQATTYPGSGTVTASSTHGSVTMDGSGHFSYLPTAGFTGDDTFTYTIKDSNNLEGVGTVTIHVNTQRVWYVQNNSAAANQGTSENPFTALASAQAVATAVGDIIYVFNGNNTTTNQNAGYTIQANNQRLIGEGVQLDAPVSVNGGPNPTVLRAAGTAAKIGNAAGDAVTVTNKSGVIIRGFVISDSANGIAVSYTAAGGGVTISNNSIAGGTGNAIDVTTSGASAGGSATISTNMITGAGAEGIDINANGTGTLNLTVDTNAIASVGNGFDIQENGGFCNVAFNNNTGITSSGGSGVNIARVTGTTLTVTSFANNQVNGTTANNGVVFSNVVFDSDPVTGGNQALTAGTLNIGASGAGNGVGASGLVLVNTSGTLPFTTLSVFADNGRGIDATGSGAATAGLTASSGAVLTATGGAAVLINGMTIDLQSAVVTSTNSTDNGVALGLGSGVNGTFSATSGSSITNAAGDDFAVGSGTANITWNATLNNSSGGNVVDVTGHSGGTVSFTAGITDTVQGVNLQTNTNTTISFSGGLSINTGANPAFTATGGGTVTATQNNTSIVNTLQTTTATALNVANTNIGAGGLTFRSITSGTGAGSSSNGIILNTTGASGGLTVTGNGGTCTDADTSGCSGGTIQHKTGANASTTQGSGIYLNSTASVSLTRMYLHDFQNFGIRGLTVNGFTLANSVINTTSGFNGDSVADDEGSVAFDNLTGTSSITSSTIAKAIEADAKIINTSGTLNLTVDSSTFKDTDPVNGLQGLLIQGGVNAGDAPTITATVTNCTFTNNRARHLQTIANSAAVMTVNVGTNGVAGSGGSWTGMPAAMIDIAHNGSATGTFNIRNATFNVNVSPFASVPINIFNGSASTAGSLFQGTIDGNSITAGNNSGFDGISLTGSGPGTFTAAVTNNTLTGVAGNGINYTGAQSNSSNTSNLTIQGNSVTMTDPNAAFGIQVSAFASNPGSASTVCAQIGGSGGLKNTVHVSAGPDIRVDSRFQNGSMRLPGYGGAAQDLTAVKTFVVGNNTTDANSTADISASTGLAPGGSFVGGAACSLPPLLLADGGVESQVGARSSARNLYQFAFGNNASYADLARVGENTSGGAASDSSITANLSQQQLDRAVVMAQERWSAAGLNQQQFAALRDLSFVVSALPGSYLGEADCNTIRIDRDAGGKGWFIDTSLLSDSNFGQVISTTRRITDPLGVPAGRVDLLTAIEHEMGHKLGLDDSYAQKDRGSIMYGYLTVGERRIPASGEARNARPEALSGVHHLTLKDAEVRGQRSEIRRDQVRNSKRVTRDARLRTSAAAPMPVGPDVNVTIGNLPAGKSVTVVFKVTLNNPPNLSLLSPPRVTTQGTVSGSNFTLVNGASTASPNTDDPAVGGTTDTTNTPVDLFDSTTTLGSSLNPANQGDSITFTATVAISGSQTPTPPSPVTPTGTVTFKSDGVAIGTCTNVALNGSAQAQCTTSSLSPPSHNITADYSGDGNYDPSTSNTVSQTIIACLTNPVVTNTNDSGAGSLRDAITTICSSPNNNVTFNIPNADPNHSGGIYTITLSTGEIPIAKDVNVTGPNSVTNTDPIIISGGTASRVFNVNSGKTATISNLNVTGGNGSAGNGGAIINQGTLNLLGMAIYGNTATGQNGGGIFNDTTGTLRVINSTLSGNSATLGGGVYNSGSLTLTNATISGNTAANFGGGVYNLTPHTAVINNTIVAGNTVEDIDASGADLSGDYNLVGDTTGIGGGLPGTHNVTGVSAGLGALAFNGGVSKTMALQPTSPAIEAGNNALAVDQNAAALTTDQRGTGFPRIADSADADTTQTVDIGAFELHPSVEDIADKSTAEDTPFNFNFNIGDGTGALITSVTATSGNTTLIPNANLSVTGSGSTRNLAVTPAADANTPSDGTATITVTVTATNGRTATDTFVVTVTEVNDAPTANNDTVPDILEDSGTDSIPIANLLSNDAKGPANESGQTLMVTGVSNFTGGTAVVNGSNIDFTPTANFSGPAGFDYTITDNGTTNGAPDPKTSTGHVSFNITAVNDAPAGADKTVTINEDNSYTFAAADFGFTDPNDTPANNLLAVKITTLPAAGSLTDNNVAVVVGQFISVADINGGKLKFTPAADANGSPYASFTFQVQDDGGTTNGGVDLDQSPNTITINVTAVNDAPAGADKTVTILEDSSYTFAASDFGFTDPNDTPANNLLAVKITTLPAAGSLTDNNVAVVAGQFIPVADINGGKLKFTPATDGSGSPYTSFTFQVQDDGGTTNSGVDLDQSPNTMTINVTAINDAPAGADKTVTINEDNSYTFAAADFGFTDPNDSPANNLLAVKITTLPAAGSLTDNNVAVVAGQFISVADINGGKLKFTPAADANGSPYASFTFQVQDDGGTTNGGVDLDQSPNTMTINVTAVNDAPAGTDKTVTTTINTAYVFAAADFGFTDPNDTPANTLLAVKITTLPAAGTLTDNNVAVVAGQFIPVADINGGLLKFTPAANSSGSPYASFTFQVQDNGGTTNSGVDLDQSPNTMTINVGQPALTVLDAVRAEPTSGTANMLFTVVLNPQLAAQTVTVDYGTATGGATPATSGTCGNPGVDFQPTSGTLTFNPGETTKTIKVSICSDNVNEPDETFLMNLSNANGATISRAQATGTIKQANLAGTLIISEIRTSGPGGLGDDFVELYNNTDSPLTVAASDASAGYGVFKMGTDCSATPVLIATISNGTTIPARGHYLLVGSQYSLGAYATGDQTLTSNIESDRNVGLFNTADVNNLSTVTRLDAVGFGTNSDGVTTGVCDLLREGSNLPAASGSALEYSFFRKECDFQGTGCTVSGTPKDTNDNSVDFLFADTQGTLTPMGQQLGAPGPQNKASGIQRNATLVLPLLDNTIAASGAPNRVRDTTPNTPNSTIGPLGTLSIRRRVQNNTGGDVTALRFRIIDITSFPSPVGTADLRATTSSDVAVSNIHDTTTCVDRTSGTASNCTVNVKGTTLEQPPNQTKGGAFNSSLKVDLTSLPGSKLAAGSSVEIQLLFGVVQPGHFRVLVNVEDDVIGGDSNNTPGMTLASFVEEITVAANQTISFDSVANRTFGDGDFNLNATASSGLPVSYAGSGTCAVTSAGNVHLTGAGTCTVTASQSGDASHNPATSQQTFAIDKATPATSISSSLIAAKLTQNVTFTATVTPPANTTAATGTMQFRDDGVDIGPAVTLDANGTAAFSTAALTAGTHTITAVYSGNSNFNASMGTLSSAQVVTNRPLVNMAAANYEVKQSDGFVRVVVNRTGDLTVPVTVDYATDGSASGNCANLSGVASLRCDVTAMYGTFRFAAGETQKTLDIPINQDAYTQGPEAFTLNLSNVTGTDALLVTPASANITINDAASPTPNAIDDTTIFVRQQYHDFLNREPDAAGLAFWKNNVDVCNTDATEAARYGGARACIETKRVITSAAFFLSIEFRGTGGLVRDFYVAALDRPASGNMPGFVEFTRDTQAVQAGVVVGMGNWQRTLDANREAFMADFVMRPEFVGLYTTSDTPDQYVDKLYSHANVTPANGQERLDAIAEFGGATTASDPAARGRALLRITQNAAFQRRELNRGFVQMQYFGYLRRNPNDEADGLIGFDFWLGKLNQFSGDFIAAEMVKAFIASNEYRQRFGTP
jgi:hypothetical protein